MLTLASITVSGVLSSCEASATKRRCCAQARSTGRSARRERNRLMRKNAARLDTPTSALVSRKRQTAEISCSRLTKAMFEPSRRKRRAGEEVLPSEPPAASAWATAEAASSEEISTACALRRRIFPSASSVTLNVGKSASRCSLGRSRAGPINSFCASPPAACISSARSAMSFSVES